MRAEKPPTPSMATAAPPPQTAPEARRPRAAWRSGAGTSVSASTKTRKRPRAAAGAGVAGAGDLVDRLEDHRGPVLPGDRGRPVGRVVVADDDLAGEVHRRHGLLQSLESPGKQVLLVVGGHDDGVVWRGAAHAPSRVAERERRVARPGAEKAPPKRRACAAEEDGARVRPRDRPLALALHRQGRPGDRGRASRRDRARRAPRPRAPRPPPGGDRRAVPGQPPDPDHRERGPGEAGACGPWTGSGPGWRPPWPASAGTPPTSVA